MRRRLTGAAGCLLLLGLAVACGGGGGPAGIPASGASVCDGLKKAERFRYVFSYSVESPKQENPPENPEASGYAIGPLTPDFRIELKHAGAAVQPDRVDFELTTPNQPEQPGVRSIRIGVNQWFLLRDTWQVANQPSDFPWFPQNVCEAIVSPLDLAGATGSLENVGGVQAQHLRIEGAQTGTAARLLSETSDMGRLLTAFDVDLWLSEDKGRLIKVEGISRANYPYGRELSMKIVLEIGPYNEDGIEIEPPL